MTDAEQQRIAAVVVVIDGHDWRYVGDGWHWDIPAGQVATWDCLLRHGYSHKLCMTCEANLPPSAPSRPCNEVWSDKTGFPSLASATSPIYWPKEPYHAD